MWEENHLNPSAPEPYHGRAMTKKLSIGPFRLSLAFAGDGAFLGVGAVSFRGVPLRSAAMPWCFRADADGFEFRRFTLLSSRPLADGGTSLRFASRGEWAPRSDEADAMDEPRVRTPRLHAPRAVFTWTLRPVHDTIEGETWEGLSTCLRVASPDAPLHTVLEAATWEIGGSADGATLIQQDVSTMDLEQRVRTGGAFSTIEKFHTPGWGGAFPMDMLPRGAGSAFFDFQWKGDTALAIFAPKPGLTRARIDKFAGEDVIHYLDRPFIARAARAAFPERIIYVRRAPKALARHEARNLWIDCFTHFRDRLLAPWDLHHEEPQPMVHAMLWDEELKQRGASWTEPLRKAFATYARLGFKETFTHGVWESVTSDPAPKRPGNICCPYAYRYAPMFGGPEAMRATAEAAAAAGIRLYQWFSFQLSRDAPVWKEHPDWILRKPNGEPWNANYDELWSGRLNGPYGDWIERQIADVLRDTGISGAFWESYQNLGFTCIDWPSADRAPQSDRILRLQAAMQRAGWRQRAEIVTPYGVSQVAMFGFQDDEFRRRLWDDCEKSDAAFALLDTSPAFFSDSDPFTPERISPARYFWLAAHRAIPGMQARPWSPGERIPGGDHAEEYARVNRLYNAALPRMRRLRLVRGGACVLWLGPDGAPALVWCFRACKAPVRLPLADLESGKTATGQMEALHVYEVRQATKQRLTKSRATTENGLTPPPERRTLRAFHGA